MSDYTRRLKKRACSACANSVKKDSSQWKSSTSSSTQNMRVKQIEHRNAQYDRSINGFNLAMTNQGTTTTCCGGVNKSTPLTQHSYGNYLRRKTLCVASDQLSCSSSTRKVNTYKRFVENGSNIYLENKKLRLIRNVSKDCPPKVDCISCKKNLVIYKKLPYQSSSSYLERKKAKRCFAQGQTDFELPMTGLSMCRHI